MTDNYVRSMNDEPDGDIQRLLELAGPRLQPPADVEGRIRAATLEAFENLPKPGTRSVSRRVFALAAAIVLTVGVGYVLLQGSGVEQPAGEILYATGGYTVRGSEAGSSNLISGSIVQTSQGGRLFIALEGNRNLRLDHGASLTIHSSSEIWLHSGRVYIDAPGEKSVTVVTPFASVTDVGTQFEVSVSGDALSVATREGLIDVRLGEHQIRSQAAEGMGEELIIDGLEVTSRTSISTTGDRWGWTQDSRPLFGVREKSVYDYLNWAARESGRTLHFDSPLARQQADLRRLSGQGEVDADPDSVDRVLTATSFYTLVGQPHELIVGLRAPLSDTN